MNQPVLDYDMVDELREELEAYREALQTILDGANRMTGFTLAKASQLAYDALAKYPRPAIDETEQE